VNSDDGEKEPENKIPWKSVGVLVTSQFIVNSGFGFVIPVLPSFAAELGMGATGVGVILSSPSITRILVNQPLGRAADRYGRKPLMVAGTLIMAASSVGTGLATSFLTMFPFRLLMGLGTAASTAGSQAYMADLTEKRPAARAQLMGLQQTAITAAFVGGPMLGGILTELFGVRTAFFCSAMAATSCCLGYSTLRETLKAKNLDNKMLGDTKEQGDNSAFQKSIDGDSNRDKTGGAYIPEEKGDENMPKISSPSGLSSSGSGEGAVITKRVGINAPETPTQTPTPTNALAQEESWINLLKNSPSLAAATSVNFSLYLGYACMLTVLPLHANEIWNATAGQIGALFSSVSALGFVGTPLGGWAADKFGRKAVVVPSALFIALGAGSMAFVDTYQSFLGAVMLWGAGNSLLTPGLTAFSVDLAPETQKGSILSLTRQAGDLAFLIGPVGLGMLAEATSISCSLGLTSSVVFGSAAYFGLFATDVVVQTEKKKTKAS